MRNRKPAIPVPWPASRADDIISAGVPIKNSEHGTLIAAADRIVANRMEFSEDGSLINSSRAQPYSHRKGQNIRPRKIGMSRIEPMPGACCVGPMIELMSTNKLSIKKIGARTEGPTVKTKKATSGT
jgi:hypothetical protein